MRRLTRFFMILSVGVWIAVTLIFLHEAGAATTVKATYAPVEVQEHVFNRAVSTLEAGPRPTAASLQAAAAPLLAADTTFGRELRTVEQTQTVKAREIALVKTEAALRTMPSAKWVLNQLAEPGVQTVQHDQQCVSNPMTYGCPR